MTKLVLSKDIYTKASVDEVIKVYRDYAKIDTCEENNSIVVSFYDCRFDEYLTIKEFESYLIGVENANGDF